jgi:hypothetical protein
LGVAEAKGGARRRRKRKWCCDMEGENRVYGLRYRKCSARREKREGERLELYTRDWCALARVRSIYATSGFGAS